MRAKTDQKKVVRQKGKQSNRKQFEIGKKNTNVPKKLQKRIKMIQE